MAPLSAQGQVRRAARADGMRRPQMGQKSEAPDREPPTCGFAVERLLPPLADDPQAPRRVREEDAPETEHGQEVLEVLKDVPNETRIGRFDRHGREATSARSWTSSTFLARRGNLCHARARESRRKVKRKIAPRWMPLAA